jgi:hypothetical protein
MVDETDPNAAPAGNEPAGNQTAEVPVEPSPPATEADGDQQTETEAQPELDLGEGVVEDEQADEDGGDEEQDENDKTRLQRYRENQARLKAENEALRARAEQSASPPSDQAALQRQFDYEVWQEIGNPPDENDPRYQGNYVKLERDRQVWEFSRVQVEREVRKSMIARIQRAQENVRTQVAEHKARAAKLATQVKDYNEVMSKAKMPVSEHVERLLLASKKSERLGYVLAKNENKLAQLNRMSVEEAAREIGRLEGRLSLPQSARTQTKARKPITPLKGTGAAPTSGLGAVNAWMKKEYGDRA